MAAKTATKSKRTAGKKKASAMQKSPRKKAASKKPKKAGGAESPKPKSAKAKSGKSKKNGKKPVGPVEVKSGKGASAAEVAREFATMLKAGAPETEIWEKLFHKKCVSIEGAMGQAWEGRKAMKAKAEWFYGENTVHSMQSEGPFVGATGFTMTYTADIEMKSTGQRQTMTEVGVYHVKNGKIVQEEFMSPAI